MPVLTIQLNGLIDGPDGTKIPLPSFEALRQRGPIVQVHIKPHDLLATQLAAKGETVPSPASGFGLIDTGASMSCVDDAVAKKLGLPVIDVIKMASASHEATDANVYPVQIELIGAATGPLRFNVPAVAGAPLAAQGLVALIGRDILSVCHLVYHGQLGQITLSL